MQRKLVLMLEDDGDDRYITESAVADLKLNIEIRFFSDSNQFLESIATTDKPSLLLIDYNSVPENGLEVLKKIKKLHPINSAPVVILSDSVTEKYRNECYAQGASSFIKKPETVAGTEKKIETFFSYWLEVVEV